MVGNVVEKSEVFGAFVSTSTNDRYSAQLFLLKLYYSTLVNFLSQFCNTKMGFDSTVINDIYLRLCICFETMLELDDSRFKDLKGMYGRPFETLLKGGGEEPDFGSEWELTVGQQCAKVQVKIDELFILNGTKDFEIDKDLDDFLKYAADSIKAYKTRTEQAFDTLLKKVDANLKRNEILGQGPASKRYSIEQDDIVLDKHIVLAKRGKRYCLLLTKIGNTYSEQVFIRPQSYRLIRFLYDMRNRKQGYKLQELVLRSFGKDKKVVSMRIKEINEIPKSFRVRDILRKFPQDEWGLSKELDCC